MAVIDHWWCTVVLYQRLVQGKPRRTFQRPNEDELVLQTGRVDREKQMEDGRKDSTPAQAH